MPIPRIHEIMEADQRILNAFSPEKLHRLGQAIGLNDSTTVLDLACGKAEMLATWARDYGISGLGVDFSEVFVADARDRVRELGVADRITIEYGDARNFSPRQRFDVACCIGATWIGNGVEGTIELLRQSVTTQGLMLIGEPFWRKAPTAEESVEMGFSADEFSSSLHELVARFTACDLDVVEMFISSEDDWDRYVAPKWLTMRRWLEDNPHDPMFDEVRAELTNSQLSYTRYQRDMLGWGIFGLLER
ncbi:SAM-dependent methyltransferase [Spelaeicoccus albus]|uniref:Cyclopropane fatty-acyl-phospholipid synthase-like methyltransferase n=1 Tax=Spelaeicoccus albus TaxID=1280376 RepID=A0A7Z0A9U4_9MICO|nr:class I SAM-dependent methyltransferase [Spelaeicoccus albus]NYI66241.1 cyclopropane fatty-acyl-phospholipid synthase-like methyltransferase [Spelaeicoccus albus]